MAMQSQSQSGQSGNFPLDNLSYDLITILHEKAKALEAYDKYQRDAQGNQEIADLFQQIRRQDEQHIQQIYHQLGQLMSNQSGTRSRAVGGGTSMGGSPDVSLSTPAGKISSKVDTDDTTNQL